MKRKIFTFLPVPLLLLMILAGVSGAAGPGTVFYGYVTDESIFWNSELTMRIFDSLDRMNRSFEWTTDSQDDLSAYPSWLMAYQLTELNVYRAADRTCNVPIDSSPIDPDRILYGLLLKIEHGNWTLRVYPTLSAFKNALSYISEYSDKCDTAYVLKKLEVYQTNRSFYDAPCKVSQARTFLQAKPPE